MQRDKTNIRIFLSLGTNVGDRKANLHEALERLKDLGLDVVGESSIYETEPVGYANQDWFLNQVIEIRISNSRKLNLAKDDACLVKSSAASNDGEGEFIGLAGALLRALLKIEKQMGRQPTFKNAPRVIDIDLLLFGDFRIEQTVSQDRTRADLIIPHPRMCERRFVLEPLCEIAPDLIDPWSEKTFTEILAALDDRSAVRRLLKCS